MSLLTSLRSYYRVEGNFNDYYSTKNCSVINGSYSTNYGKLGKGVSFPGSSSGAYVNPTDTLTTPFSVSLWIKTSTKGTRAIFCNRAGSAGLALRVEETTGFLGVYGGNLDVGSTDITDNVWHHVVLIRSSNSNAQVYLDNHLEIDITDLTSTNNSYTCYGFCDASSHGYFQGYIDEIGVWDKVLTTDEITQLYNNGVGLTYPFNEQIAGISSTTGLSSITF